MRIEDLLDDREPDPAALRPLAGLLHLIVSFEDPFASVGWNAAPAVLDANLRVPRLTDTRAHAYPTVLHVVLDRIREQVDQHLEDLVPVRVHAQIVTLDLHGKPNLAFDDLFTQQLGRLGDQRAQVEVAQLEP